MAVSSRSGVAMCIVTMCIVTMCIVSMRVVTMSGGRRMSGCGVSHQRVGVVAMCGVAAGGLISSGLAALPLDIAQMFKAFDTDCDLDQMNGHGAGQTNGG